MKVFSKLFGKAKKATVNREPDIDEPLLIVPIPPLVTLLSFKEAEKGAPLSELEVLALRDGAICMTLPLSQARAMAAARGYDDLNSQNIWEEWQAYRAGN